jgi:hypothetical protein
VENLSLRTGREAVEAIHFDRFGGEMDPERQDRTGELSTSGSNLKKGNLGMERAQPPFRAYPTSKGSLPSIRRTFTALVIE